MMMMSQLLAEGEQHLGKVVRRFQRRDIYRTRTQRFTLGYNVGRLWRLNQSFQTAS